MRDENAKSDGTSERKRWKKFEANAFDLLDKSRFEFAT